MPVSVGIVAKGDLVGVAQANQFGHGKWAGAVHADLSVMVHRHEGEARIHARIDHLQVELEVLRDRLPVGHRGAAQRVNAAPDARIANSRHINHVGQICHVGADEVILPDVGRGARPFDGNAADFQSASA